MTRAVQINLKQQINSELNNEQIVISSNGLIRTSLSATVTRGSNFVEENVFRFFYIVKTRLPVPVDPNTSKMSIAMLSACSMH